MATVKPKVKRKRKTILGRGVGRPLKITPARLKAAQRYYKECKDSKQIPWSEELAIYYLDVDADTVRNWCAHAEDKAYLEKQKPETRRLLLQFFGTIKKLATMQLFRLKKDSYADKHNTVGIFLMKANHGMVETTHHEITGKDGQPIRYQPIQIMGSIVTDSEDG